MFPSLLHQNQIGSILVLPYMASLVAKKKRKQLYYYVVESARVDGQPRIVHQAYLGTAEKVAALVKGRTSPVPLSAASRDFGLPGTYCAGGIRVNNATDSKTDIHAPF